MKTPSTQINGHGRVVISVQIAFTNQGSVNRPEEESDPDWGHADTYPDMLEVEGQVSDKRFNQSLLHPEVLFCLFKYFIF